MNTVALLLGLVALVVIALCAFIGAIMWELQRVQCPNCGRVWARCDLLAERNCPRCGREIH